MASSGIKTLAIQVPMPGAPLFAVNNHAAGQASGKALASEAQRRWGAAPPVAVVIGMPEAGALFIERATGAKESMRKVFPGIELKEFSSKNDVANVRQLVTDLLTSHPGRKVMVWVHVDEMAMAAVSAVANAGRNTDVVISTTGGGHATFPTILKRDSTLLGTYSFFPEAWGPSLVPVARKLLQGETVAERMEPPRQLFLDAANLRTYYPGAKVEGA